MHIKLKYNFYLIDKTKHEYVKLYRLSLVRIFYTVVYSPQKLTRSGPWSLPLKRACSLARSPERVALYPGIIIVLLYTHSSVRQKVSHRVTIYLPFSTKYKWEKTSEKKIVEKIVRHSILMYSQLCQNLLPSTHWHLKQ